MSPVYWIPITFAGFILIAFAVAAILIRNKKPICKHSQYQENMACHGICLSCGEDLGFIQPLRESNPQGETGFQAWDKDIGKFK